MNTQLDELSLLVVLIAGNFSLVLKGFLCQGQGDAKENQIGFALLCFVLRVFDTGNKCESSMGM